MTRPVAVVAGSLAQRPARGGHSWVFLHYLLGLRALGWEVLFLDRLETGMCRDARGAPSALSDSANVRYLRLVMQRFGFDGAFALYADGKCVAGLDASSVRERVRRAAILLDIMGFFRDEEVTAAVPLRVFLDIDPGFPQMWSALDLAHPFAGYDAHATVGRRIGSTGCTVPPCGLDWIPTSPPVFLDAWPPTCEGRTTFTSVASWRGAYGPVDFGGTTYGLRVHEFRRFVEIPRRTGMTFELALDIDAATDASDVSLLERNGWTLADPATVARHPDAYREYLRSSYAEFSVAKAMYVETCGGWFSDRSACYLASGKPVVVQDTCLAGLYPTGEGLLTYESPDEAVDAVEAVLLDYDRHQRAARAVAEEYFDSRRVLTSLLARLGVA